MGKTETKANNHAITSAINWAHRYKLSRKRRTDLPEEVTVELTLMNEWLLSGFSHGGNYL